MSSYHFLPKSTNEIDSLSRDELIERLLSAEVKISHVFNDPILEDHSRDIHDLQVHKIELEMQNRHMVETQLLLEESRSKYADLYESCPAGLATVETCGRILQANATAAFMLRMGKPELIGGNLSRYVIFEDRSVFCRALVQCVGSLKSQKLDVEVSMRSGASIRRMHVTMQRTVLSGGPASVVALSMVDVSEQFLHAQREGFLAAVAEQFCTTLEINSATRTILNMAVPRLADFAALNLCGDSLMEFSHHDQDTVRCDRNVWANNEEDLILGVLTNSNLHKLTLKTARTYEWKPGTADSHFSHEQELALLRMGVAQVQAWPLGRRGDVLAVLWLVWSSAKDKQILASQSVVCDFTHRAALSLDNVSLYHLAQSQIRSRSEFLAIVAHDLRNPLTVISMRAERLLQNGKAENPAFARKSAEVIGHCASRMGTLVRDLLDATSMDSRKLSISPQYTRIADIIDDDLTANLSLFVSKGLTFEKNIDESAVVYCDPRRANQVLANLIGNALKFTEAGGFVSLKTKVLEETVQFSVQDSGRGMDEKAQSKIFEPFWQANSAVVGVGLGLNICKKIVLASGGAIWCDSGIGFGTTFYFTLPRSKPESITSQKVLASASTILVVDDDEAYRETISEFLAEQGYAVSCADNGRCAIDWIEANGAPDLILLDLQMPVMDGLSFLKRRDEDENLRAIPVTVMSAATGEVNVKTWSKTRVLNKMTPMQDVLRAIATAQAS